MLASMRQFALPAMISIFGIMATQIWYVNASKMEGSKAVGTPIATLQTQRNQIERKPTTRLIWQDISKGEPLYAGEAVRTSPTSSGKIRFLKSGVTVGLEPDSVVIIEENNGQIALNLVNGGLFVKDENQSQSSGISGSNADQPLIRAGKKTLSLSDKKAELNLSMTETGQTNLLVSKGNVSLSGDGEKTANISEGKSTSITVNGNALQNIELIGANAGTTIPLTSANNSNFLIKWRPLSPNINIQFESGLSRSGLMAKGRNTAGNLGSTYGNAIPGEFFWRLVGTDQTGKVVAMSPTIFSQGIAIQAPQLITNSSNEKIVRLKSESEKRLLISWSRPSGSEQISIDVSQDPEFAKIIDKKSFSTDNEWELKLLSTGKFYWRASATWPGIANPARSKTGSFTIDIVKEIPAPSPISPRNNETFMKNQIQDSGVLLSWEPSSAEGNTFDVTLEQYSSDKTWKGIPQNSTDQPQFRLVKLTSGLYRWSIKAKYGNQTSTPSEWKQFSIIDILHMDFAQVPKSPLEFDEKVEIPLKLIGIPKSSARIRFKIANKQMTNEGSSWQQGQLDGVIKLHLKDEGHYSLVAEALNSQDKVLASTDPIEFEAKFPDLLPAPALAGGVTKLKASARGDISIAWTKVPGATRYLIEIKSSSGGILKKDYLPNQKPTITGLRPGGHTLTLTALDARGKRGKTSGTFEIAVPETSDVAAPTSKGLKIR